MSRAAVRRAALLLLLLAAGVAQGSYSSTLYVARRGWHIDIGMAVSDLAPPLQQAAADLPDARYVFFGFADKHYLMAAHHNGPVLFGALWPGASIVLTTGLPNTPAEAFGEQQVIALSVTAEQLRALQSFIWGSLRTQDGALKAYSPGPYDGSVYFLGTAKYSALHTCNTWGAEALRAAGLRVNVGGVVFANQLWSQVRHLKQTQNPNGLQEKGHQGESVAPGASLLTGAHPVGATPGD